MNSFKRDMDKYIGDSPRFKEPLKRKILMEIKKEKKSSKFNGTGHGAFKFGAIFTLLLIAVASFLVINLTENDQQPQTSSPDITEVPVLNFADRSENWKVTYTQKDMGESVRESSLAIEYIGEGLKPEEVSYKFSYEKDQESFGGSLQFDEQSNFADEDFTTCTACILYKEKGEISGTIEWGGQKENLVLTNSTESKWQESPLFESNNYTMIGEEGRAGFIYGDNEVTRFYEDQVQKYMWHFWGSATELTGYFKVIGTHENSSEEIVVVPEGGMSIPAPNNGADHHVPTHMALPEKGIWKLEAVIDDEIIGTVFVEVHEN